MSRAADAPTLWLHLRADGDYGWGHLLRAARLASAPEAEGWRVLFFIDGPDAAVAEVSKRGFSVALSSPHGLAGDAMTAALAAYGAPDLYAVDMLQPNASALSAVRASGAPAIVFSDEGQSCIDATLTICPNPARLALEPPSASPDEAMRGDAALGALVADPCFVVIPPELAPLAGGERSRDAPLQRLFINTGGVITKTTAVKVVEVLRLLEQFGASGVWATGVTSGFSLADLDHGLKKIAVIEALLPLPNIVERAGLAWVTAGYIRYELAYCRTPMALTAIADHQERFGDWFSEQGLADYTGDLRDTPAKLLVQRIRNAAADAIGLRRRAEAASAIVDGKGAARLWRVFGAVKTPSN